MAITSPPQASPAGEAEDGPAAADGDGELRGAWWRLRTWRRDVEILARVRQGLETLPTGPTRHRGAHSGRSTTTDPDEPPSLPRRSRPGATDGPESPDQAIPATAGPLSQQDGHAPSPQLQRHGLAGSTPPPPQDSDAGSTPPPPQDSDVSSTPPPPQDSDGDRPPPPQPGHPVPDPAIAAVRETFALVTEASDDAASYFYASLFVRCPHLRELFPPAMDEQRDRLLRALARIVETLSTPEEMARYLTQLGRDHRKYSVEPAMYEVVGEALIVTLRKFAGERFTPAAEAAWGEAYAAVSALMIRAAEEDADAGPAVLSAEVVDNDQRRPGLSVLTVAPEEPLVYEAGQHVTVQTPRWPRVWRPYSIACRPRDDGLISFHVRAVPGGWVSNALVHHTAPGDEILIGPALGTMTLRHAGSRDLVCVAGGTGLSPVKAIIEQAVREAAAGQHRQIVLFCGARTRGDLYDLPDLWRIADAYSGFQLTPVTSDDPAFDGMQGNVGRVAARYLPHRDCEAYVAGPPAMVRETLRVLVKAGLPRERVHCDEALLDVRTRVGSGT